MEQVDHELELLRQKGTLKKAGEIIPYTRRQIIELQKCSVDYKYAIRNYFYIIHPVEGEILFKLRDYQERMIDLYQNNRKVIVMCARQAGKSQLAGAYLLCEAIFKEKQTILVLSNNDANAKELIYRIQSMYESIPNFLKPGLASDGWNKKNIGFDNGSRIISQATTENSGRGLSISLVFADEFAFVGADRKTDVARALWVSLAPTLSTGGRVILSSTPNTDEDLFAEIWQGALKDSNGFKPLLVKWSDIEGRDEEWKRQEIENIGEEMFLREHECEFIGGGKQLIDGRVIKQLKSKQPLYSIKDFIFWKKISKHKEYIVGVDPSTGIGKDFSVIEVFSFPDLEQVGEFRSNTTKLSDLYIIMRSVVVYLEQRAKHVYYSLENNSIGEVLLTLLENDEMLPKKADFISKAGSKKMGFSTNKHTKASCASRFKELLESGKMKLNSEYIISELKTFASSGGSYEAKSGGTDDCIMATYIILRIIDEILEYSDDIGELQVNTNMDYFEESDINTNYFDDELGFGYQNNNNSKYDDIDEIDPIVF